ncbi:MAG: hypothetical protein AB7T17_06770 [Geobacter sp.]|jgi:hypothetical protein
MAAKGQTKEVTTKDKDFEGSGIEGQKGNDDGVVRGEDVIKILRDKGHRV